MKIFKILAVFMVAGLFLVGCEDELRTSDMNGPQMELKGDKEVPNGEHFNLNIIGVKDKVMDDIAAGGVIFVDLWGTSNIYLVEGDDYAVLDKNGTDDDGALLQLPPLGVEPYITDFPDGFDTETDYSVWVRPLGKPLTGATITLFAQLSEIGKALDDKKDARLWENLIDEYGEALTITWGEQLPVPLDIVRPKGKSKFQEVTAELLTVLYEVNVSYYDEDLAQEVELVFYARIPVFSELLQGEYWEYVNDGLKLLQVRFYPFGVDLTESDDF